MRDNDMKDKSGHEKSKNEFLAFYKANRFHSDDGAKNCIEDAMLDRIEKYSKPKSTDEFV